jgi:hypothetical protein
MAELPPHSRISLRIDGNGMTLIIPRSTGSAGDFPAATWAVIAIFAFLAVTLMAQGLLSGYHMWTGTGLLCLVIAAWQWIALAGRPGGKSGQTKLQIAPNLLIKITGPVKAPQRQQWGRSTIADVRVDPEGESAEPALNLHFSDGKPPVCILSGNEPEELNWIAEQIRLRWGLSPSDSVASAGS